MSSIFRYVQICRNLRHIKRYNSLHMLKRGSVADHVHTVLVISMLIADQHAAAGGTISYDLLARLVVLHDLEEVLCGDVSYYLKYDLSAGRIAREYEKAAIYAFDTKILPELPDALRYPYTAARYEAYVRKDLAEVQIVHAASLLDMLFESLDEIELGNKKLYDVVRRVSDRLRKEKYTESYPMVLELIQTIGYELDKIMRGGVIS